MKFIKPLSIILMILTVVLAVISYIVLPDQVVVQISGSSPSNYLPKIFAVLIPAVIGIGGALTAFFGRQEVQKQGKALVVSGVGILAFILMFIFNL